MRHLHNIIWHIAVAGLGDLLFSTSLPTQSQAQTAHQSQHSPLHQAMISPNGPNPTLHDYVRQTVTYPEAALQAGVEGEVYLEYFVQENGLITEVRTLQGIGHGCDETAEAALRRAPSGLAVPQLNPYNIKTKSILVVRFTLQNSTIATYEY